MAELLHDSNMWNEFKINRAFRAWWEREGLDAVVPLRPHPEDAARVEGERTLPAEPNNSMRDTVQGVG